MSTAYVAWVVSQRPIFSRLPQAYQDNSIADWLTAFWDQLLVDVKAKYDDLPRQLNPLTCDIEYLDFLAPILGWTDEVWDKDWTVDSKRQLLANSYTLIWPEKGSQKVLSFILTALKIEHQIEITGSFRVGISDVGDEIGLIPWDYTIYLPDYYRRQPQEVLTRKINSLFGPVWCDSRILFEEERFRVTRVIGTETGQALATEDLKAIQ